MVVRILYCPDRYSGLNPCLQARITLPAYGLEMPDLFLLFGTSVFSSGRLAMCFSIWRFLITALPALGQGRLKAGQLVSAAGALPLGDIEEGALAGPLHLVG